MQDELLDSLYYLLLLSLLLYLSRHRWRRWFKTQKSRRRFVSSPEEDEQSLRQQLSAPYLNGSQFHKTDHFFAVSALLREVLMHYEEKQIRLNDSLFTRKTVMSLPVSVLRCLHLKPPPWQSGWHCGMIFSIPPLSGSTATALPLRPENR